MMMLMGKKSSKRRRNRSGQPASLRRKRQCWDFNLCHSQLSNQPPPLLSSVVLLRPSRKIFQNSKPQGIMSLVQYVVLRKDLQTVLNWPLGALLAQACHASTAVLHLFKDDPNTESYLAKLDSMHKVVLQAPDEESLTNLATKLTEKGIDHKLWIEQPENIPTCIALKPYLKNEVKGLVQQFKLYS